MDRAELIKFVARELAAGLLEALAITQAEAFEMGAGCTCDDRDGEVPRCGPSPSLHRGHTVPTIRG